MGHPVVHFEVIGTDGERLQEYYSQLFDWRIDATNEMGYGIVAREENLNPDGIGIGGGVAGGPRGTPVTSSSTWRCRTSRSRWPRRRASAEPGCSDRTR